MKTITIKFSNNELQYTSGALNHNYMRLFKEMKREASETLKPYYKAEMAKMSALKKKISPLFECKIGEEASSPENEEESIAVEFTSSELKDIFGALKYNHLKLFKEMEATADEYLKSWYTSEMEKIRSIGHKIHSHIKKGEESASDYDAA